MISIKEEKVLLETLCASESMVEKQATLMSGSSAFHLEHLHRWPMGTI
jgi:hypothetical protein